MENSFRLGRVAGIEIGIHYTWLFAFALLTWSLAESYFPASYRGWGEFAYWVVGALAALLLFASVLVHELSHSFMALVRGQGVHSITLFIFGGVSNLRQEADSARDEFLVAVVGPLTSFVLAALFFLLERLLQQGSAPGGALLTYLAFVNLVLGVFNLLPGFPLDGGRVLRSLVWALTGSLGRATRVASISGQGLGFLMIFVGVWQIGQGHWLNGLWTAFVGWFLNSAAEGIQRDQVLREGLRGVSVGSVMNPNPPLVSPDLSVETFVRERLIRQGQRAALLVEDGRLIGIVSITDVQRVPQEDWAAIPVSDVMTSTPLKVVTPEATLDSALQLLVDGSLNQLPVVQQDRLVGLLSRADVLRFLQLRESLHLRRLPDDPALTGA